MKGSIKVESANTTLVNNNISFIETGSNRKKTSMHPSFYEYEKNL